MAERPLPRDVVGGAHVDYLVRPMEDREELRRMLAPYRHYAAYALGQLQPELFARSEWWLARGATGEALLLHSRGGLGSALFVLGAVDGIEALLRLHPGPRHTFLTCQVHHLETVARQYLLVEQHSMLRMLVDRETFRPASGTVSRLKGNQVRQMNSLYRSEGTPAFYSAQNIDEAVYYAAFAGDRIVAVAGTHVEAPDDAIAVAGNVFTHPAYRGQGLGRLVTGAVTEHLLKSHREVVLSVDPRNEPAVAAYRRLGFREVSRLIEGAAVRRDLGLMAIVRRRVAALRGRRYGAELVSVRG
ncbi:MAG: GNAT family N-acetyltransferase [Chloroflexi bacterium]|nr:GNAT family N-acetyltransferase [Chloroflexota bacterium]